MSAAPRKVCEICVRGARLDEVSVDAMRPRLAEVSGPLPSGAAGLPAQGFRSSVGEAVHGVPVTQFTAERCMPEASAFGKLP